MVFATSKIIGRAPVVKFTFHGHGGRGRGTVCIVGRVIPFFCEQSWRVCIDCVECNLKKFSFQNL